MTRSVRRFPVLLLVAALLAAGGLLSSQVGMPRILASPAAPASLASLAAPVASDASSWYCTGASGPANPAAQGTLYFVNSGVKKVTGTLTVYEATGHSASEPITVPGLGETTAVPGTLVPGYWLASRVDLAGGGVAVSQLVAGSTGWSMAPCSTVTAPDWYFASGATTIGNSLYVSVFNPTPVAAVVDITFVTTQGPLQPAPFQGLIVAPDTVVTAEVASYVQDEASVATVVRARSGRVVASELQLHASAGQTGLSLRLGSPGIDTRWYLPATTDATGGSSQLVVFNPTGKAQHVKVAVRLPSGPVAPLEETVAPRSTWTLELSGQTRIPQGADYALAVTASGRGVVVDRVVAAPATSPSPQWGAVTAVVGSAAVSPTGRWLLPNPALGAAAAEPGAQPSSVALLNPGNRAVKVTVASLGVGARPLAGADAVRIGPHAVAVVPVTGIGSGGLDPLVVTSDLPLAVTEDATPAGVAGVVSAAAIPQA